MERDSRPQRLLSSLEAVLLGKAREIRLLVAALLSDGHVLLEDVPGTGKTTLARSLAQAAGLEFRRVQFTPDLLPSDLTGGAVWRPSQGEFEILKGPVFSQVLLADEINRASPRTQSALLEAMEERQVSLEGSTHPLPDPFLVLATQNPVEFHGVFPLPEAQMDRFLIRLSLGYPSQDVEHRLVSEIPSARIGAGAVPTALLPGDLAELRGKVRQVHLEPALAGWIVELVRATRQHRAVRLGASPRVGIALAMFTRALALLDGRDHVRPEDVVEAWIPVAAHRVHPRDALGRSETILEEIRLGIPLPV
ncbi:MAG: MoxR family ATPase [Fibrobacteria bacterium]|nr:MoxR family ATPase [Fibrobacteria bacterium]